MGREQDKDEIGWVIDLPLGQRLGDGGGTRRGHRFLRRAGLPALVSVTLPENISVRRIMEHCRMRNRGQAELAGQSHVWYSLDADEWRRLGD